MPPWAAILMTGSGPRCNDSGRLLLVTGEAERPCQSGSMAHLPLRFTVGLPTIPRAGLGWEKMTSVLFSCIKGIGAICVGMLLERAC